MVTCPIGGIQIYGRSNLFWVDQTIFSFSSLHLLLDIIILMAAWCSMY